MKEVLILDLETTSPDAKDAIIKVFGAYDPVENKFFIYRWNDRALAKVVELLTTYKYIITFNGLKYDLPVLERHGVPINFKHIDVRDVIKYKRAGLLRGFKHYSLKGIIADLQLDGDGNKGEIDYEIFKKQNWTPSEQEQIITYLKQDLLLTWKLWKYLLDRFSFLARFLKPSDVEQYKHITTSLPTYAYKAICNQSGVQELYDENPKPKAFPQPYSLNPRKKEVRGLVAHLQFNSLYAHLVMQYNLLKHQCNCCFSNEGKYHGKNIYTLKGYYCIKSHGPIEKFLQDLAVKAETDKAHRALMNIIYSQIYNVMTNSAYYTTYNPYAVHDCFNLARQQGITMLHKFEEHGYFIIDIDVDDVFVLIDPAKGQSIKDLLKVKDEILTLLKSRMPYPSETFKLDLKDEVKYLRFFGRGPVTSVFMRRGQYVYVTNDGQVGSKGVTEEDVKQVLAEA